MQSVLALSREATVCVSLLSLLLLSLLLLLFLKKNICRKGSPNISLFYEDNMFNVEVVSLLPQLSRRYTPPCWVRNRVVSTLIFGVIGRFGSERMYPVGSRQRLCLADGTNAVFDLYLDPVGGDPLLHSTMIVLIPGISNHSGTDYVRAYIEYASGQGFKVACLNHIGSACGERLNPDVPRIHTYGGTGDLTAMVDYLRQQYPDMKYIAVGFSLGANILLKYLGERPERQAYFLCAQSWCQGYDVGVCLPHMDRFSLSSALINHLITKKKKAEYASQMDVLYGGPPGNCVNSNELESKSYQVTTENFTQEDESKPLMSAPTRETGDIQLAERLFQPLESPLPPSQSSEEERALPCWVPTYAYQRAGRDVWLEDPPRDANGYLIEGWEHVPPFDINEFERSSNLMALDAAFTRTLLGFKTVDELYRWACCYYFMDQIRDIPLLLVNTRDDPIVPWRVVENILNNYSMVNRNAIGVVTQHGGHLGFFEGSCFARNRVSWADRVSVLHARSIVQVVSGDFTDRV